MTIPLIAFLYLYLLFIIVWLVFTVIAFYHIVRFGQIGFASLMAVFVYLAVSMIILYFSFQFLSQIDWNANFTVWRSGGSFFGSNDSF